MVKTAAAARAHARSRAPRSRRTARLRRLFDACASAAHRAFDFWIGEWDAYRPGGDQPVGRSTIAVEDHGCVITEHWRSLGVPYSGRSLNSFDALAGKWFQYWMDSTGDITRFEGGLNDAGQMVLTAVGDVAPGQIEPHWRRMTFTPNPDGSVRQHGEASPDGETWTTTYDFTYRRHAE
jgi:hypothetical protein